MQFSALFSYILWHIEFKFCIWLCFNIPQSKFECRHFATIFVQVMPLCELGILEIFSFPHFSLTCFDVLSWNFAYDFVLLYYRSSSSVINLRKFLWELLTLFLQHALTYWAEILHISYYFVLLYYRSSSSVVNFLQFLWELCPFWNLEYWKYTVFRDFLLHALIYWTEILHITLFYCTTDQVWVSSICVFFRSYASFRTYNTVNTVFCTFLLHALT